MKLSVTMTSLINLDIIESQTFMFGAFEVVPSSTAANISDRRPEMTSDTRSKSGCVTAWHC